MVNKPKKSVRFLGVVAIVGLMGLGVAGFAWYEKPTKEKWASIEPEMTQEQVVDLLGRPKMVLTTESALKEQYGLGWACTRQSMSAKVAVYYEKMLALYIWFDADNRVEETCIARS